MERLRTAAGIIIGTAVLAARSGPATIRAARRQTPTNATPPAGKARSGWDVWGNQTDRFEKDAA